MSQTNKQHEIKIPIAGRRRSRFNWTHDVNTTFAWGEIQPTQCKLLVPNSNTTFSAQSLIRLAPMVAPTFGRVKYKTYNQFVPLADVFPNFDALMAQEPVSTADSTQVPYYIPRIPLGLLSSYVLVGARATLYWVNDQLNDTDRANAAAAGHYMTQYRKRSGSTWSVPTNGSVLLSLLRNNKILTFEADPLRSLLTGFPTVGDRVCFNPYNIGSGNGSIFEPYDGENSSCYSSIPLGATSLNNLLPIDRDTSGLDKTLNSNDYSREVTFESADYVVEFQVKHGSPEKTDYFAIAFECSDLGKRFRKIIQGCGYQIDLSSTMRVSILPLLAQFKAYFDVFGLQLYQGYETTYLAQFIKYTQNIFGYDVSQSGYMFPQLAVGMSTGMGANNPKNRLFVQFMYNELANEWYTDNVDFVSAHTEKLAVSPTGDSARSTFLSVDANGIDLNSAHIDFNQGVSVATGAETSQIDGDAQTGSTLNYGPYNAVHAFIDQVQHSQVDAELLKRMYKWTNRNSLLGREIAKLLRAQGLGRYVEECKSNYIGATDNLITISDVISNSDTWDPATGSGAVLGEYGGRGLQYTNEQTLKFENDVFGYWVTLATIVPKAGYTQGIDPTLECTDKWSMFNPDFDALGAEITRKNVIVGSRFISTRDNSESSASVAGFGFIPRDSRWKVCQNLVNGDFNRHNMRNTYLPYTLDRQINVNDFSQKFEYYTSSTSNTFADNQVFLTRSVDISKLPIAGNIWRIPTKYAWLGNYNRIFYRIGEHDDDGVDGNSVPSINAWVGYSDYNDDNFMSHAIFDLQCYAPMKPIEESYGLEDDENPDKGGVTFTPKA